MTWSVPFGLAELGREIRSWALDGRRKKRFARVSVGWVLDLGRAATRAELRDFRREHGEEALALVVAANRARMADRVAGLIAEAEP